MLEVSGCFHVLIDFSSLSFHLRFESNTKIWIFFLHKIFLYKINIMILSSNFDIDFDIEMIYQIKLNIISSSLISQFLSNTKLSNQIQFVDEMIFELRVEYYLIMILSKIFVESFFLLYYRHRANYYK